jgi:hypothetical protein
MNQHHAPGCSPLPFHILLPRISRYEHRLLFSILCTQRNNGHMSVIEGVSTEFITGNDPGLECTRLLGGGGFGKVYCVGRNSWFLLTSF